MKMINNSACVEFFVYLFSACSYNFTEAVSVYQKFSNAGADKSSKMRLEEERKQCYIYDCSTDNAKCSVGIENCKHVANSGERHSEAWAQPCR